MSRRRKIGLGLMSVGLWMAAGGLAGFALGRSPSEAAAQTSNPAGGVHTTSAPATPAVAPGSPTVFLGQLSAAIRSGDSGFLVSNLDPAVSARFGADTCKRFLSTIQDPTANFSVVRVDPAATYRWKTGSQVTDIPGAIPVVVKRTLGGTTSTTTIHLSIVGGTYRWFTDCSPGGA